MKIDGVPLNKITGKANQHLPSNDNDLWWWWQACRSKLESKIMIEYNWFLGLKDCPQ